MNIFWDAEKYKKDFSFVPQYGEAVMDLLDAAPGSRVVDLGCGNGALTEQLAACGYDVTGVDASAEMLELAREGHPELKFLPGNALDFTLDEPVDAVFSNAVLHWIDADKQQATPMAEPAPASAAARAAPRRCMLHWKSGLPPTGCITSAPSTFLP